MLEDFWLTELESDIYQAALPIGLFAASMLSLKLKIPRTTARYACMALVEKWLMTEIKRRNTKLFCAENPTKLYAILNMEEESLRKRRERAAESIKRLQETFDPEARRPKVSLYEWLENVEEMYGKMLEKPTNLYSFSAGDYFLSKVPDAVTRFRKKSPAKYEHVWIIRSPKYAPLHTGPKAGTLTRYFRTIDELKVDIQIVEDRMSIVSVDGAVPMGLLIEHREIVETFRQLFREVWNGLEKP